MTQFEMMTSTELSGSGMFSISPFRNSTLVTPRLLLVFARQCQHVVCHVQAIGFTCWPYAFRREQHIDAATGAKIENGFSGAKIDQGSRIAASQRSLDRFLGNSPVSRATVEICRDRIAATKAGVTTCLHTAGLRHSASRASVFLLDLFLNIELSTP